MSNPFDPYNSMSLLRSLSSQLAQAEVTPEQAIKIGDVKTGKELGLPSESEGEEYEYIGLDPRGDWNWEQWSDRKGKIETFDESYKAHSLWDKGGKKGILPLWQTYKPGPNFGVWRLRSRPTS